MEDDQVRTLVRILKRIMSEESLSMQGMAHRLGFATSHLSMILSGKRRPGLRFMWAAMRRYPEIEDMMLSRRAPAAPELREHGSADPETGDPAV